MFTVTLIAAGTLTDELVGEAQGRLADAGCVPDAPVWIDRGNAARMACNGATAGAARTAMAPLADRADIFAGPGGIAKLLIADMDSTMITVECIDELADYAGIKPQIAAITERAMRGELDFRAALAERVALLQGLDESVIAMCLAERVRPMPGARILIQTMKAHGARCVLVSGGFTRFAQPVADRIGFDLAIANQLEIADGQLTGRVLEPIIDSGTKLATLHAECTALGIGTDQALAVGDGANDVPMLVGAGLGVAYHGHPAAVAAADAAVRHGDLTALLWAQGIPMANWVTT
ncbi:MAG: phosphoserine phosphatase SerB [Sphingopyxis sp.]